MQVTRPHFRRPRFHRPRSGSTAETSAARVLVALTALAWVMVLLPGEADWSGLSLTEATVVERREADQKAVLRISHPTEEWVCEIPRTDFPGDWPDVGGVITLVDNDGGCGLPPQEPAPSAAMRVSAILGTVLLAGWALYAVSRGPATLPQPGGRAPGRPRRNEPRARTRGSASGQKRRR